jgi:hypothetical protein
VDIRESDFAASASGREAVMALAELARERLRERLREREKTRRLLLLISAMAFLVGSVIITFAPADKQYVAYILGAVLIIFALGSIGASQFVLKMLGVEVSARDERLLREVAINPQTTDLDNSQGVFSKPPQ